MKKLLILVLLVIGLTSCGVLYEYDTGYYYNSRPYYYDYYYYRPFYNYYPYNYYYYTPRVYYYFNKPSNTTKPSTQSGSRR